ncbi:MAG: adenylate/guanylate cyclase domain-containing protein [Halieaceae bacterium]|jgi:class 3 adenylate cyclase|nr:adenylate/guanylate cyclase domain-containing protein [Halieaceae bacterium]
MIESDTKPDSPNATEAWAQRVLVALETLQRVASRSTISIPTPESDDFAALFKAGEKLVERLQGPKDHRHHDLMNIIGAIRGYSEMLDETADSLHPALREALTPVLRIATQSADGDMLSPISTAGDSVVPSEGTHAELKAAKAGSKSSDTGMILAVDDMPENRDLVSRLLTRAGHTVVTAESGEEALELLTTLAVDVVLLDLMMPGVGGAEVLRRMKDNDRLRATPVIMISGRQDMDQIVSCIQAGADDYLLKPFNPVLLQARIAAGIERKRWHDREEQYRQQLERNERFIRSTFGRYLSDDIVDELLENPEGLDLGGDLREVTIMMSDIRGFTTLSEQLKPQQVMRLLNRYLGRMTDVILEHGGTIDEFLGDAVLAVFGAPKLRDDDAERAMRCAIAMQAAMDGINAENKAENLPELSMAIALNTGAVVAGNIGSERRAKYGFVGHNMNVTSRIEDHVGPGEILASKSTLDAAAGKFATGPARELSVKGIEEQLLVFPVTGLAGEIAS